jgi:hypothetical protein
MPYKLRKAPNRDLYWVVNKETNKKFSKDPLPKEDAMAQMRALYANTNDLKGGKMCLKCGKRRRGFRGGNVNLKEIGKALTAFTDEYGATITGKEQALQRILLKIPKASYLNHIPELSLSMKDLWYALNYGKVNDYRLGGGPERSKALYEKIKDSDILLPAQAAFAERNKAQGPSKAIVTKPIREFTFVYSPPAGFAYDKIGRISDLGWSRWTPAMERVYKMHHSGLNIYGLNKLNDWRIEFRTVGQEIAK